ncbi:MAG TPA: GNAT family N-acetyltransferase [Thermoanaerobaculia bacterium]|nr:GNAT family N-acetyltransferase [Thermoanaerobaculia bacterium]
MIEFRESPDRAGVEELRARCFPEDEIEKEFSVARTFVAEEGGRPVAHLAFMEQAYEFDGVTWRAALAMDAMTDPAYRRQGLFARLAGFARDAIRGDYAFSTAWQIRPAVLPAMVANGWEPVLRAPVFVRPIWRNAGLWPAGSPASSRQSVGAAGTAAIRPAGGRRYRVTENLVTRETVLKGHRTLALVELTPHAKREIQAAMRETTCRLAAALLSWRHPAVPLLLRMGFLPSPHRFRFLVNVFDPRFDPRRVKWALSWADTDHL